jgi:hypothetical protein
MSGGGGEEENGRVGDAETQRRRDLETKQFLCDLEY